MKLSKLLKGVVNLDGYDLEVMGITADSREVKKGFLFVAIKGQISDGHDYINSAIKSGAIYIIGEENIDNVNYLQVKDSRKALGIIAANWFGNPSKKLKIIGVTGTKGKTTTCHMIYHMLCALNKKAGIISTLGLNINGRKSDIGYHITTPDVISVHKYLKKMVDSECEYAIIEVSSHGIDQQRIAGINFDVGVLTNIKPEHLDYHKSFRRYKKVKLSFIDLAIMKVIGKNKTNINLLPESYNNINVETALDVIGVLKLDRKKALKSINTFKLPEGRMQKIANGKGLNIVIDFAHTPDSFENVLPELLKHKKGKLICVFGCAGERDIQKRSKMGKIASKWCDIVILTAEDPRSENVKDIIVSIEKGIDKSYMAYKSYKTYKGENVQGVYFKIPERGEAVLFAISRLAKKDDTIAVLGKGHEKSMCYGNVEYPWSDKKAIEYALKGKTFTIKKHAK